MSDAPESFVKTQQHLTLAGAEAALAGAVAKAESLGVAAGNGGTDPAGGLSSQGRLDGSTPL